jgi:hypothetical protein
MKKHLIRNISWIALIAVWSFLAGAYFHLGWVRDHSLPFRVGFIMGGIGMWIVFVAMGIFVYRFLKKSGNEDPAKFSLGVVSFFTICFLLIAWVKYDDVQKDKFVEDLEASFVIHYQNKAADQGIEIEDLEWELMSLYSSIYSDLKRHPQVEQLMPLTSTQAVFEENRIVAELCLQVMKMNVELGYPPPAGMVELFE